MSESETPVDQNARSTLAEVEAGEQVLVTLDEGKFDYGRLPEAALSNLFVVSVGRSPQQIEREVRRHGGDPGKVGVVPVTGSATSYDGPLWTSNRVGPNDLTGISIEFSRGFNYVTPGTGWVLVDSVNILLMYAGVNRVFRLLDSITSACRQRDARGVYVLNRDAVTAETMNAIRGLFDRVLE